MLPVVCGGSAMPFLFLHPVRFLATDWWTAECHLSLSDQAVLVGSIHPVFPPVLNLGCQVQHAVQQYSTSRRLSLAACENYAFLPDSPSVSTRLHHSSRHAT
ncbi:hypothetical protein EDB80DRAFT_726382 [Ilyonectria destructans]|nr:hypothetical protein EDB80DRAFT_726382 [Ilyonectria destructans]